MRVVRVAVALLLVVADAARRQMCVLSPDGTYVEEVRTCKRDMH